MNHSDEEIAAKKLISKLIKICGVDGARFCFVEALIASAIISNVSSLFSDKEQIDALSQASEEYNWPKYALEWC